MVNTQTANPADTVLRFAVAQVGKPYVWGAAGPSSYDCSGLVVASYKQIGMNLPHFTGLLIAQGHEVSKAQLAPGDLVFPDPGHVQIYVGNGKIVEAPEEGKNVRVVNMWGFWRARRLVNPGTVVTGGTGGTGTGTGTQAFGGVGDALGGIKDAFSAAAHVFAWLTTAHNWLRIAMFISGVALLTLALFNLDATRKVVNTAKEVTSG